MADREQTILEKELHERRKEIDGLLQKVKTRRVESSEDASLHGQWEIQEELSYVAKALKEAKMWLGVCFEKIGQELPAQYADKAE